VIRRPTRSAGVILFDASDNVLLARVRVRRAWEYPGGRAHRDEPLIETARRELLEETGLRVPLSALLWFAEDDALGVPFSTFTARFPYTCPVLRRRRLELSALDWYDASTARQLLRPELLHRYEDARRVVADAESRGLM